MKNINDFKNQLVKKTKSNILFNKLDKYIKFLKKYRDFKVFKIHLDLNSSFYTIIKANNISIRLHTDIILCK